MKTPTTLLLGLALAGCIELAYTPASTADILRGQRGACRSLNHRILSEADIMVRYKDPGKQARLRAGTTVDFSAQCGARRVDGILHCPLTSGAVANGCRNGWRAEGVLDQGRTFSADDSAATLTDAEASSLAGITLPARIR